jgi:hypothetical protein
MPAGPLDRRGLVGRGAFRLKIILLFPYRATVTPLTRFRLPNRANMEHYLCDRCTRGCIE